MNSINKKIFAALTVLVLLFLAGLFFSTSYFQKSLFIIPENILKRDVFDDFGVGATTIAGALSLPNKRHSYNYVKTRLIEAVSNNAKPTIVADDEIGGPYDIYELSLSGPTGKSMKVLAKWKPLNDGRKVLIDVQPRLIPGSKP